MDTFIDKIAQKRNAQEMIRANMTAEVVKMEQMQEQVQEQMKEQMKAYDELMQEIRKVNLQTAANVSEVQDVLKECISRLETLQTSGETETVNGQELAQIRELLEEKFKQSDDFLHRENVKVYRNVQAAVAEELGKQTEELKRSQVQNRGSRAVVPISVLILIGVIADILIKLFSVTIPLR